MSQGVYGLRFVSVGLRDYGLGVKGIGNLVVMG